MLGSSAFLGSDVGSCKVRMYFRHMANFGRSLDPRLHTEGLRAHGRGMPTSVPLVWSRQEAEVMIGVGKMTYAKNACRPRVLSSHILVLATCRSLMEWASLSSGLLALPDLAARPTYADARHYSWDGPE